ncbi:arginine deiminase-related protein [Pseudomarimonas arenosa]|uniref:Amidinotransferase n=1 Tax=Pseudomarimonas arenosa TaxID=2774145 RepID=A0AAW3ZGM6_9GAMM|nr:arginine deiminase-related protein [Pseudomarimonas arenosa]MBD8524307.1 amidinotransferase [Pseudomarimonas arenosa]
MLIEQPSQWARCAAQFAPSQAACARAAFLVTPQGFAIAAESQHDNVYMLSGQVDSERALAQHRALQAALAERLPVIAFPGHADTPDAVFPNNVFATAQVDGRGRLLIGSMRHPVRQREAERADIPRFFSEVMGYELLDLRQRPGLTELTGTLVIDRSRGLGFAGLSPRCDRQGVATMADAFALNACFAFALQDDEYHTNVVLSVLAGRAVVGCPAAFQNERDWQAIADTYGGQVIELDAAEKAGFAGNCIALDGERVWMSERAADGLRPASRAAFERAGFAIGAVALDEIERAGGSLRCCVAEIF